MSRYKVLYIFCRWILLSVSDQLGSYVGTKGGDKITGAPEEIQVQLLWEMFHASFPSEYSWTNTHGCEAFHVSNLWEVVHTENTLTRTRNETYELDRTLYKQVHAVTMILEDLCIWKIMNKYIQKAGFAQAWKVLEFRGLSWKVLEN